MIFGQLFKRTLKGNILDNKNQTKNYKIYILISYTFIYLVCMAYFRIKIQMCFHVLVTISISLSLQQMLILMLPVKSQIPFFRLRQEIPLSTRIHRKIRTLSKM